MLHDARGRTVDYLRLSVTDYCNLRCRYCLAPGEPARLAPEQCLSFSEMAQVARAFVSLGGRKIRLTGGEPLRKRKLPDLVRLLAALEPRPDLTLTTNGVLLARWAAELAAAGVQRVNVSCDTLRPATFRELTGSSEHAAVMAGLLAAQQAGLNPVRLNAVILRGVNDDEPPALAAFAREHGYELRFIEQMPVAGADFIPVAGAEIRAQLGASGWRLEPELADGGIAVWYRAGAQRLGFISAHRHGSCATCSRLRLSFDGRLRPCLYSPYEIDLKPALRAGAEVRQLILAAVAHKPVRGVVAADACLVRPMQQTGG